MAREYELMVVLRPDVEPDQVPARMEALRGLVTAHGGAVTDVTDWGRRRLAHPIKQQFEGHYVITHFTSAIGEGNHEVERALNIDESVLRHLIVRRDA